MALEKAHKFFLQAFIANGIFTAREVHKLYRETCERFDREFCDRVHNEPDLGPFVESINMNIKPFQLEMKKAVDEANGVSSFVLVNTADNSLTKLSSTYSENELELFKKLVEKIVGSGTGSVSSIEALNLSSTCKMKKPEAESFFTNMIEHKWLKKIPDGHYALATRCIAECDLYILQQYPDDARTCNMCCRLVIQGESCRECNTTIHKHCSQRYFKDEVVPVCPNQACNAEWLHRQSR
ncbi:hypothetical protein CAPTEDRAFT_226178 [Capitella teleta]|uniref:Non-structural maintenance of chromosomes element 1 homolog n=1 Tax=Capitella teleta TaxID=283909 RepID=R7V2F2_CAPTE|nr:hypothetical protein CAPTEDRAFT_226178 [Capitella teleta]|eukprot:ELU12684.1 hypothetical protein CAPTEDRAFT_226178 [Capitella teleta]